jgi:phosphomannomutase
MKRLLAFDLDGTLAESKQPLGQDMASVLAQLLEIAEVAVISGGDWPQFERQIADRLVPGTHREGLWLMPTTGTKLYRYDQEWRAVYSDGFDAAEKHKIRAAFAQALDKTALSDAKIWGEQLEDRDSQFTFSGLGQEAPLDAKAGWDPDRKKRKALQAELQRLLPDLSIRLGGTTSIDVTRGGIDKAYALRRLATCSDIPIEDMLFFGDALYPGGNDQPVQTTGVASVQVRDPDETRTALSAILACADGPGYPRGQRLKGVLGPKWTPATGAK